MKHLLITIIAWISICFSSIAQYGDYYTAAFYDGYWSQWQDGYDVAMKLHGNYHNIIIYLGGTHPSNFYFKFEIDNFQKPEKKEIKQHYKKQKWYEYSGWVEYNICDEYPSAKAVLKANNFPWLIVQQENQKKPTVTKRVRAIIKIAPYKETPKVYNIYYEDVGFAIDLKNLTFKNW